MILTKRQETNEKVSGLNPGAADFLCGVTCFLRGWPLGMHNRWICDSKNSQKCGYKHQFLFVSEDLFTCPGRLPLCAHCQLG